MRIACLWIPAFAARVAQVNGEHGEAPIVVVGAGAERHRVMACSAAAERCGIRPGMAVGGVAALCPEAVVVPVDPVAAEAAWATILTALLLVSPVVEADPQAGTPPGRAYLDLRGLYGLYPSPERLLAAIEAAVRPEWRARVGAGPGKFAAWLAARAARPGRPLGLNLRTVAPFRRDQPVAALPVSEAMQRRLKLLGLRTLGQVAALPRGAVLAQFGVEGGRAWDLARGRDSTRLVPYTPPERVVETVDLPEPASLLAPLVAAVAGLVTAALRQPYLQGRMVRRLRLLAAIEGGRSWATTVVLKGASADPDRILGALKARLVNEPPEGAVESLTLELTDFAGYAGYQPPLFRLGPGAGPGRAAHAHGGGAPRLLPVDDPGLAGAIAELKTRYGSSAVARIVEVEPWSRLPERRYMLVDCEP